MAPSKPRYATNPDWSDIAPIPQDDGGPNALATIAYSDEYREASEYLRAVMTVSEYSERTLTLTAHLIELNPAHYTVWLYRAKILQVLQKDIREELEWLNDISLRHIKNYQIWHHRQVLIERLISVEALPSSANNADTSATRPISSATAMADDLIPSELSFLTKMLVRDAKNYHVWSYRQWLVSRFALWSLPSELSEVERLLRHDVRNNSAWNHRWFVVFGREKGRDEPAKSWKNEEERLRVWEQELDFVKEAIDMCPENESSWNYLRGLLRKEKKSYTVVREFAEQFAVFERVGADASASSKESGQAKTGSRSKPSTEPTADDDIDDDATKEEIRSSYALDLLADAYAEDQSRLADADKALRLLANRYDTIRANYWNYRRELLGPSVSEPPKT